MMRNLFGALFVLITAATGCAIEDPDATPPRPTLTTVASEAEALTTVASEAEALATVDELARVAGDEVDKSMPMVCDSGGGNGICCWFSESGSFDCVTW